MSNLFDLYSRTETLTESEERLQLSPRPTFPPSSPATSAGVDTGQSLEPFVCKVRVVYPLKAQSENDLPLHDGMVIGVIRGGDRQWWKGKILQGSPPGKVGKFPKSFVEIIDEAEREDGFAGSEGDGRAGSLGAADPAEDAPRPPDAHLSMVDEKASWVSLLREHDWADQRWRQSEALQTLVFQGIPSQLRANLWAKFILDDGMADSSALTSPEEAEYYSALCDRVDARDRSEHSVQHNGLLEKARAKLKASEHKSIAAEIEKDLSRTSKASVPMSDHAKARLRRVLKAYTLHNPIVGYCQGLNFIANALMITLPTEVALFRLFREIVDRRRDVYCPSMVGGKLDAAVLSDMLAYHQPELLDCLERHDVNIADTVSTWLLCMFLNNPLGLEDCLRFWDVYFFLGEEVLFLLAISLVR